MDTKQIATKLANAVTKDGVYTVVVGTLTDPPSVYTFDDGKSKTTLKVGYSLANGNQAKQTVKINGDLSSLTVGQTVGAIGYIKEEEFVDKQGKPGKSKHLIVRDTTAFVSGQAKQTFEAIPNGVDAPF